MFEIACLRQHHNIGGEDLSCRLQSLYFTDTR